MGTVGMSSFASIDATDQRLAAEKEETEKRRKRTDGVRLVVESDAADGTHL